MEYIVRSGDTLSTIARRHRTSIAALLRANPSITDPGRIRAGQRIALPQPAPDVVSVPAPRLGFARKRFYDAYRERFGGALKQGHVEGLEALLAAIEADPEVSDLRLVAYMLATVKHETADTYKPITEYGSASYFDRYDPVRADTEARRRRALQHGNTEEGDGFRYRGRGYVQITWKSNYRAMGKVCGEDLVSGPDLALDPRIAYRIMSHGMRHGSFTGRKIGDYLSDAGADYYNARQVINGHDKAELIAGYAAKFEQILSAASVTARTLRRRALAPARPAPK